MTYQQNIEWNLTHPLGLVAPGFVVPPGTSNDVQVMVDAIMGRVTYWGEYQASVGGVPAQQGTIPPEYAQTISDAFEATKGGIWG